MLKNTGNLFYKINGLILGLDVALKAKFYSAIIWMALTSARKNVFNLEMTVNMLYMDGSNQLQLGARFTMQNFSANHSLMDLTTVDQVETMEFIPMSKQMTIFKVRVFSNNSPNVFQNNS